MLASIDAVPPDEVPAWRQRGTVRQTAAERRALWMQGVKERAVAEVALETAEYPIVRKDQAKLEKHLREKLMPKSVSHESRRQATLYARFSVLPRFLRSKVFDASYQSLRVRVETQFSAFGPKKITVLSRLIEQMEGLRKADIRSARLLSNKKRSRACIEIDLSYSFKGSMSAREFRDRLLAFVRRNTVAIWMTPRTDATVLGQIRAKTKMLLDSALRQENAKRKKDGLPAVRDRDALVLAGYRGAHWRQAAVTEAKHVLELCATHQEQYRFRGALSLMEYRHAFGLRNVRDKELQGLGHRHFAGAQVLLELSGEESEVRSAG